MDEIRDDTERRYLIADMPNDERPRERLQLAGADSLKLEELIGILLRTGYRGRSAVSVGRDVLERYAYDLQALSVATPRELAKVKGIGLAKATELCAAFQLAVRLARFVQTERPHVGSPESAADYLRMVFAGKQQEELHVLVMDTKNRLVRDETITIGLLDRSQAHPREVFRPALQHAAAKILLAHNHPSGDPTPSQADIAVTAKIVEVGQLMEIPVVDHLIIGTRTASRPVDFYSFRQQGLM